MESKKINQLATELAPELSDLTIIGDPTTGISKKITLSQMASLFTGTVEEYANLASFPLVGTADTIYIALDTNIIYRWNTGTSAYVELSPNIVTSLVFNDANGFDGTISLVGSTATLTITTALTQGSIPFIGASGALSQDNANLFFDDTNNRLGINTNTPTTALDVFGSGIIGRLNGTSTNNAFLGFASVGSNKWSIGNVQSDHRFRIYNEATTSELVSVLQTGEFGIGIANPLTKLHIFGGASALIANLDTNTSVAKSISFRSGNSSRFNIEVSGTESGSNAGMDFYLRAYTDAGALLSTPLTISRSTGAVTLSSSLSATSATFTSTQTNLILNTTTNTSFTKLSFQENGSEKATITYPNSTFGAPTRREKLEISNLGGINFITQNAPLTPNVSITSDGNVGIATSSPLTLLHLGGATNKPIRIDSANGNGAYFGTFQNQTILSANRNPSTGTFTDTSKAAAFIALNANTSDGNIVFATTASNNTEPSTRLTILNTGITRFNTQATYASLTYEQTIQYATSPAGIWFSNSFNSNNNAGLQLRTSNDGASVQALTLSPTGAATFTSTLTASGNIVAPRLYANADNSGCIVDVASRHGFMKYFGYGTGLVGRNTGTDNSISTWLGRFSGTDINAPTGVFQDLIISNNGAVTIPGSLSKGSGSFRIDHPLESMAETHQLVHSFVEAPQADLYYRGKLILVNGKGQANIDEVSTMTEGTFEALCREVQCFTTNETGWDLVKGKVIGNIIYIESQNVNSTDEISWLVIGERKDKHMMDTDWTDENGKVIVEPLKPIKEEIKEEVIKEEIIENTNE